MFVQYGKNEIGELKIIKTLIVLASKSVLPLTIF